MKRISLITIVILVITLSIGVITTSVFATQKKKPTPTSNEKFVTPTEIITAITETPPPPATGEAALESISILTATQAGVQGASAAGGQTAEQTQAGGGQQGVSTAQQSQQQAAQTVTSQSQQTQVLGTAGMAPTGSFARKLMNIYIIFGMLLVAAGFISYAKEKNIV